VEGYGRDLRAWGQDVAAGASLKGCPDGFQVSAEFLLLAVNLCNSLSGWAITVLSVFFPLPSFASVHRDLPTTFPTTVH
jgi:hypothetical protein